MTQTDARLIAEIRAELEPLAARVNEVIRQRNVLADLLGELLATIELPQNREHVHPLLLDQARRTRERVNDLLPVTKPVIEPTLPAAQPPAFDGVTPPTTTVIDFRQKGSEGRLDKGNSDS